MIRVVDVMRPRRRRSPSRSGRSGKSMSTTSKGLPSSGSEKPVTGPTAYRRLPPSGPVTSQPSAVRRIT
nr:hypothetical protein [Microbispora rosea]